MWGGSAKDKSFSGVCVCVWAADLKPNNIYKCSLLCSFSLLRLKESCVPTRYQHLSFVIWTVCVIIRYTVYPKYNKFWRFQSCMFCVEEKWGVLVHLGHCAVPGPSGLCRGHGQCPTPRTCSRLHRNVHRRKTLSAGSRPLPAPATPNSGTEKKGCSQKKKIWIIINILLILAKLSIIVYRRPCSFLTYYTCFMY